MANISFEISIPAVNLLEHIDTQKLNMLFNGCTLEEHPIFYFDTKEYVSDNLCKVTKNAVQYVKLQVVNNATIKDEECIKIKKVQVQQDGDKAYIVTRKYEDGNFIFTIEVQKTNENSEEGKEHTEENKENIDKKQQS